MVRMDFIFSLIKEKTKRKNIIELNYCSGTSRREIENKIEKNLLFFQFSKKLGQDSW